MYENDSKAPYARRRRRSRATWAATLGVALVAGGVLGGPARADDVGDQRDRVNSELDASRAKLANLSAAAQEAVIALQKTQANIAAAQAALSSAQAQEQAATDRKARIDADLVKAKKEEADGLARIATIRAEQARNTDIRDNIARQAYEGSGLERLAAVLNTDKAQDLADNMYVVEKVNDSQNAVLAELAAQTAKADAEQVKLAETRRTTATLQMQVAGGRRAGGAGARARRPDQGPAGLPARRSRRPRPMPSPPRRATRRSVSDDLQAESDRIAAQLAARYGTPNTAWSGGSGQFAVPVDGPFTSEFDWRINPILGTRELHSGLDIGVPCGTPVHAAGDGTIITPPGSAATATRSGSTTAAASSRRTTTCPPMRAPSARGSPGAA